jgi:hypothetical protein
MMHNKIFVVQLGKVAYEAPNIPASLDYAPHISQKPCASAPIRPTLS